MIRITGLMMMLIILTCPAVKAQKEVPADFGIKFSGFVKTDVFYDTRETVSLREGHFFLYPMSEKLDVNKEDLYLKPGFNILSIQTRLTGKITAPDVLGAKVNGLIEGAFFGAIESDINEFRLRHAFLNMDWGNTQLLIGQFWHPMFITDCFPGVISFNTGAPFQPFSRNPQIRLTQGLGPAKFILAVNSQRDFQSMGPADTTDMGKAASSTDYQRNAVIPELNAQFHFNFSNLIFGIGGEYKMLVPRWRLFTADKKAFLKTDEKVSSFAAIGFAKFQADEFALKLEGIYGQNLTNMTMLGGYGESESATDPETGIKSYKYSPSNLLSAWMELSYGKAIEYALFAGYTKNLGCDDNITGAFYGRAGNIESIMRVSPRIVWNLEKVSFAGEIEYTQAKYGVNDPADKYKVIDAEGIDNIRVLLAAYLKF